VCAGVTVEACVSLQGADIDVTHKEGGNLLTEFAGEGWDDLLQKLIDKVCM
jgi:hypothetical protein